MFHFQAYFFEPFPRPSLVIHALCCTLPAVRLCSPLYSARCSPVVPSALCPLFTCGSLCTLPAVHLWFPLHSARCPPLYSARCSSVVSYVLCPRCSPVDPSVSARCQHVAFSVLCPLSTCGRCSGSIDRVIRDAGDHREPRQLPQIISHTAPQQPNKDGRWQELPANWHGFPRDLQQWPELHWAVDGLARCPPSRCRSLAVPRSGHNDHWPVVWSGSLVLIIQLCICHTVLFKCASLIAPSNIASAVLTFLWPALHWFDQLCDVGAGIPLTTNREC